MSKENIFKWHSDCQKGKEIEESLVDLVVGVIMLCVLVYQRQS